jgi:hypothetical protein
VRPCGPGKAAYVRALAFNVGEYQQVTGEPVAPGHAEALVLDLLHHLEAADRLGAQ